MAQDTPRTNGQHKELFSPDRQRDRRQDIDEGRWKKREEGEGYLSWGRGTKDCPWMERRLEWPIEQWQLIKVKREAPC